jgi:threonine synthase
MLAQDFVTRSAKILSAFIGDEIPQDVLQQRCARRLRFRRR